MNILRIVYDFAPPWWGLAPGPYELSKAQCTLNNSVTVYAGEWPKQKKIEDNNLKVIRLPMTLPVVGPHLTYYPAVAIKYLFDKERQNYEIMHCHTHHAMYYLKLRKMIKVNPPLVLHMNINSAERAEVHKKKVGIFGRYIDWPAAIRAEKTGCDMAEKIICVSESVKSEVIRWYKTDEKKIAVIPNGVNTDKFKQEGDNLREKLHLQNSKVIIYVGRLYNNKNIDLIIRSLEHLDEEYKLLIIGEGEDMEFLKKLSEELGLSERVIFAGFVPYNELPSYYRSADIFLLLSKLEGFPKVVLEALSSGLKVLTSECFTPTSDIKEQITQINDLDPVNISKQITYVMENKSKTSTGIIKEKYDWLKVAEKIQEVYSTING